MKTKEFAVLGKQLLPLLPGFSVKGSLVFAAPIGHTLRAIDFDADRSKWEHFQVHAFILPLYIPREFVSFNFGRRLQREKTWNINDIDTIEVLEWIVTMQALPILANLETPLDVAAAIAKWAPLDDINAEEAIAYSLVLAGETNRAVHELDCLIERVRNIVPVYQWAINLDKRANLIKTKLLTDPSDALAQLAEWRKESLRNLKLEKYAEEVYQP